MAGSVTHRAQLSPKHFLMSPQQPVGEKAHTPSCAGSTALERTPGTAATALRLVTTLAGRFTQVGCDGEDVLQGTPRALRLLRIVRDDISSMGGGEYRDEKPETPQWGRCRSRFPCEPACLGEKAWTLCCGFATAGLR